MKTRLLLSTTAAAMLASLTAAHAEEITVAYFLE